MNKKIDLKILVQKVNSIAIEAGKAILYLYTHHNVETSEKSDHSPLTNADIEANKIIIERLNALALGMPILSEETYLPDFKERRAWDSYWLIDPLDGTSEFLKKNGEFTVNIALIRKNKPVLGVVYSPVFDVLYFASDQNGAYKSDTKNIKKIDSSKKTNFNSLIITCSRSHGAEESKTLTQKINNDTNKKITFVPMGSSLKICLVAEGMADIYPRLGPTSEWDTAAAHSILNEAGGALLKNDGNAIEYNKKSGVLNPSFIAMSSESYKWAISLIK